MILLLVIKIRNYLPILLSKKNEELSTIKRQTKENDEKMSEDRELMMSNTS